jgi:hypothetical protein
MTTAKIIDLATVRTARAKRSPPSPRRPRGNRISVFETGDHWAFVIEPMGADFDCHSDKHYLTEDEAWADAVRAVRQIRRTLVQA